jgi:hypothetical protein
MNFCRRSKVEGIGRVPSVPVWEAMPVVSRVTALLCCFIEVLNGARHGVVLHRCFGFEFGVIRERQSDVKYLLFPQKRRNTIRP